MKIRRPAFRSIPAPTLLSMLSILLSILLLTVPGLGNVPGIVSPAVADTCQVPPDHRWIVTEGMLSRGNSDGWGEYRLLPDLGFEGWEITVECSIPMDWGSLLGKRVRLEGGTVLVRGGLGGILGVAMGVGRVEILTPVECTTWGRVRSLYR
jgi:hypothetical protein